MKNFKRIVFSVIIFTIAMSCICYSAGREVKDFNIKNISVPDEYISCGMDYCDEDMVSLLAGNNQTPESWRSGMMTPQNFMIYACKKNNPNDVMILKCEKLSSPISSKEKGSVKHQFARDYALMEDINEKNEFLTELISTNNFTDAAWVDRSDTIPYIEYFQNSNGQYFHCFETILAGNRITLQFSKNSQDFSKADKTLHGEVFNSIVHSDVPDYTEVKNLISSSIQKKLEKETHSDSTSRIIGWGIGTAIALVLVLSIIMARRSQKKKRIASISANESRNNK